MANDLGFSTPPNIQSPVESNNLNYFANKMGSSGWGLLGNTGTVAGTNFIGTTDNKDLVIKTAGTERYRISSGGTHTFAGNISATGNNVFNGNSSFLGNGGRALGWGSTGALGALTFNGNVPVIYDINGVSLDFASSASFAGTARFTLLNGFGCVYVGGNVNPTSTLQVGGSVAHGYIAKTANYTLTSADRLVNCTANSFTITLPTAVGITGREYIIKNTGTATTITIATTSSQTIDGLTPSTFNITTTTPLRVMSDGANWITW